MRLYIRGLSLISAHSFSACLLEAERFGTDKSAQ